MAWFSQQLQQQQRQRQGSERFRMEQQQREQHEGCASVHFLIIYLKIIIIYLIIFKCLLAEFIILCYGEIWPRIIGNRYNSKKHMFLKIL